MLRVLTMFKALIWKDVRVNRLPLLIGFALLTVPYVLVAGAVMQMPLWHEATSASAWAVLLGTGCHFSVMCSLVGLAMLSGHLIAVERGDRSAEFLAYLPPSRGQVLMSKALVLLAATAIVWTLNSTVGVLASFLVAGDSAEAFALTSQIASFTALAAIGALATGAGWCASCMLEGTGTAVSLAIFSPMVLVGLLQSLGYASGWPDEFTFGSVYLAACWCIAPALFASGSVYYLKRVEP